MSKKGSIPWNKGIPRTAKDLANIKKGITAEKLIQRSLSTKKSWEEGKYEVMCGDTNPSKRPEVAHKIGEANKLRVVTDATKEKIRQSRLGKPNNVVFSEKVKKATSDRMKRDNPMFRKEVLQNHPILKSGPNFISIGENKLIQLFTELGFQFKHQFQIAKVKGYYTADFFFPLQDKIIEFDGHESHRTFPEKDKTRDAYILENYGFVTLRLLSPDLNLKNRKELIEKLYTFLGYKIENRRTL